jgi:hypothetical protein
MDAAERELLATSVREAIARAADADAALTQLGWLDMLSAAPRDAIAIVFTELGRAGATATVLDDVLATALAHEARPGLAVLLPEFGRWNSPTTAGLATARVTNASDVLGGDVRRVTAVHGVDPDLRLFRVEIDDARAVAGWDDAVGLGRRAIAYQIAGACRTMLDLARTHALERVQFGRPIARFQAVRHKLAETLVAIEALDAVLDAAADEPGPMTAALAKAQAGRTAGIVARHCQQVLAGIGFTTDHPFHRFMKRTMVLDGLFGTGEAVTIELGRTLITTRSVPALIEL